MQVSAAHATSQAFDSPLRSQSIIERHLDFGTDLEASVDSKVGAPRAEATAGLGGGCDGGGPAECTPQHKRARQAAAATPAASSSAAAASASQAPVATSAAPRAKAKGKAKAKAKSSNITQEKQDALAALYLSFAIAWDVPYDDVIGQQVLKKAIEDEIVDPCVFLPFALGLFSLHTL